MRGRKPKPTCMKILAGNPGRRPLANDVLAGTKPKMPPYIRKSPGLRMAWQRVCKTLAAAGVLNRADELTIARWAEVEWSAVAALADLQNRGFLVVGADGNMVKNPAASMHATAVAASTRFYVEFGLTPSARGRSPAPGSAREQEAADVLETFTNYRLPAPVASPGAA